MKKLTIILGLVFVMLFSMFLMADAIKIAPYSQPLHDIMHWDARSARLIIQNPENENQTVAWPATVDLWNYNGNYWVYDLPTGDKFAFDKEVLFGSAARGPITFTFGEPVVEIYGTCASTSGATNAMSLMVHTILTGAGQVGRSAEFVLAPTARMGAWGNAIKAKLDLSGNDGSIGLLAGVCAEIVTPATQLTGSMACVEHEIVATEDLVLADFLYSANTIAFMQFALSGHGAAVTEVDNHGQFMTIQGLTPLADNLLSLNYLTLQCSVNNFQKWILLSHDDNMYSIGISGAGVPIVASDPKIGVYTTVAAIGAGAINSVVISQVTTGDVTAGAYQGVLDVTLNSQHQSGNWANAIMSRIVFDPDGDARTGMAAVVAAEMYLPDKPTEGGSYYCYESSMIAATSWVGALPTTQVVAFEHYVAGGAGVDELDADAVIFHLEGVDTDTATEMVYLANIAAFNAADGLIKININGTVYYIPITTTTDGT